MRIRIRIGPDQESSAVFEHDGPVICIGRDPEGELPFQSDRNQGVSWRHAMIELTSRGAYLKDLQSKNGTYLNDNRIDKNVAIRPGDLIGLGQIGPKLKVIDLDLCADNDSESVTSQVPVAELHRHRRAKECEVKALPRDLSGVSRRDGKCHSVCRGCGRQGRTTPVIFHQNIGLFFARLPSSVEGDMCNGCVHRLFWQFTLVTLVCGWWGVISLLVAPFLVLHNLLVYGLFWWHRFQGS